MKQKYKYHLAFLLGIALVVASLAGCARKPVVDTKKAYMQDIYNDLKKALPNNEAEVVVLEDSVKVIFKNAVLFPVAQAEILEEMYPSFERFAKVLNKYVNTNMIITGHTDNTGTREGNRILSEERAQNTKRLLMTYNVDGERMTPMGQGELVPIADNDTAAGRAKNRRIEFIILYNNQL